VARLPRSPHERPLLAPDPALGEITVLPAGTILTRIYFSGGAHPAGWNTFRTWGPTSARFDHQVPPPHEQPDRGILYAGSDITTACGEVFQDSGFIDVTSGDPYLVGFHLRRDVRLLSLRSNWPTRAGASQALASGIHASGRGWSIAIWEDLGDIEGIEFDSSMNRGGINYALYERAQDALEPSPASNNPLAHRGLRDPLRNAAVALNYGLGFPAVPGAGGGSILRVARAASPAASRPRPRRVR